MGILKRVIVAFVVVSALLFVSCSLDSSSGGGSTPTTKSLDVSLTASKSPLFRIEDYNADVYEAPLDITFTASRNADLEVTIWYNDGTASDPETFNYSSRKTLTMSLTRDCNVYIYATATDDKMTNGAGISVWFNTLRTPVMNLEGMEIKSEEVEIAEGQYVNINSSFPFGGFIPALVYTTDSSDPKTSPTATVETMGIGSVGFTEGMTEIKAYLKLDNWKDSEVVDVELKQKVTPTPSVSEAEDGVITVMYGDPITLSGVEGQAWFTTNMTLTEADISSAISGGSWADSADHWVDLYSTTPSLNSGDIENVKFIARDNGSKYSDPVVYQVKNKLPAPVLDHRIENTGNNTQTLYFNKRSDISGIQFVCNKEYSSTGMFYYLTVPTGTTVNAHFEKTGYTNSDTTTVYAANKLTIPVAQVTSIGETRYKKLELTSPEGGTIKYILDGVEYEYSTYIEIRETATVSYWAEKTNYQDSDLGKKTVTVDYAVGTSGPAGGTIVYAGSSSSGKGYTYIELAPQSYCYSSQIYGYYAAKEGDVAKKTGANDSWGKTNTETLVSKMSNGHAFTNMVNELFKKQTVSGPTDKFAAKKASDVSFTRNMHDGRTITFDDWYLPSIDELYNILDLKRRNKIDVPYIYQKQDYWSSSEASAGAGWSANYNNGGVYTSDLPVKGNSYSILPVRYF